MVYQAINPATGETLKTFPEITDGELEKAMSLAQTVFETDWRQRSISDRAKIISAVAAKLREKSEEYAQSLTLEMGKVIAEARGEVALSADILDYYAGRAENYLKPQEIDGAPGSLVQTRPLGIILGVEPWNFPYYQLTRVQDRS